MEFTHEMFIAISKSYGLFYMMAMFAGACIYAYRPKNKDKFDRAANSIFEESEDDV